MQNNFLHIVCSCFDASHYARLHRFEKDDEEVYLSVHLANKGLFERIIIAFKYIFGIESEFGQYCEIVVDKNTQDSIIEFLSK